MRHLGDYAPATVLYFMFTTYRPSTGANYTLAGTPVVRVYKNGDVAQHSTTYAVTADFDTVTGLNYFTIDTSADGTFYAAGGQFTCVLQAGTVDSVSVVGTVVGTFTLNATAALRPTTAGRTLDVSAGGEAGVDWANVGSPTTTLGLTNTTVGIVTTTTTATNLTNERGKYALGAVWIGPAANTNTTSYTDGIITNPVSTIAAAKTIADALGLRRFYTVRTGVSQIGAAMTGYDFDGTAWALSTTGGSRDVGTSAFHNATIAAGTFAGTTGSIWWDNCEFTAAVSVGISNMYRCTFGSTLTLSEAGSYDFIDCASIVAGTSAPVFAVPAGTVTISFRRWSGGIRITGITTGTTINIDVVSGGTVTLEGADGTVVVRGMTTGVTDSRTGTPSLTQTAVVNQTSIADAVWDEAIAGHLAGGSTGAALNGASAPTAAAIADAVWDEAQADHVAAGSFGVTATEIADILVDTAEIGAAGAGLTNINLPDQTMNITGNITGNLSGSVGSLTTNNDKTGYSLTDSPGIKKNAALAAFQFLMVDSADHVTPKTGLTITATRSLDGGAFAACANAAAELSNGIYNIDLAAGDLNGTVVTLRFTATGADDRLITIVTET